MTYFEGRGLGERIRYLLAETNTDYEERIITKDMLAQLRENGDLLFMQLPLLEIDGLKLIQSGAIVRYLARKHDLYGRNAQEACMCDMMEGGLCDFLAKFMGRPFQEDKDKYVAEKVEPFVVRYLKPFNAMMERNNGGEKKGFILGDKINYPDLLLLECLESVVELLPSYLPQYPFLEAFYQRMLERPTIKSFRASSRHKPMGDDVYAAHVSEVLGWKK